MNRLYPIFFLLLFVASAQAQTVGKQGEVRWRFFDDVFRFSWSHEESYKSDRFPNGPDFVRVINSLSTPSNYKDDYTSLVKGFIQIPNGGRAVFNANGDDDFEFYLSTDATAANLVLIAADTSDLASLDTLDFTPNAHYYFEIRHREVTGGDFVTVEWKGDSLPGGIETQNWTLVGGNFLFDTEDTPCPITGTACDDGDTNTLNDREDGNCNCIGDLITNNACVGERGVLQAYLYDNLAGGAVAPLENAIANNVKPDTMEVLPSKNFMDFKSEGQADPTEYGVLIQGYINVPISGIYDFNLTGSDENILYISSDSSPNNKTANVLRNYWWTGWFGHNEFDDRNPDQTVEGLFLNANQYYYIELLHKGNGTYEFFNLFWKTPYQTRDEWLRVPTIYFFDYTCETSCVKSNVPCDDNDPFTTNDRWDGNCNCAGTPCEAPDCDDPTTSYVAPEACAMTNMIDNRADDAWLSCSPISDAPNSERNGQHWIQYDFGGLFNISATQIWNYNVAGATEMGFQQVVIDISTDGVIWEEVGTFNWNLASGGSSYEGFSGPDLSNRTARYVLISSLDDPSSCRGLSKVTFNAVSCPTIQFVTPRINDTIINPTDIPVTVNVTEGEAAISLVELYLNGIWIASDNAAPYSWTGIAALQNLPTGDYKLSAVARDANGTECELSTSIYVMNSNELPCDPDPIVLESTTSTIYRTSQTITSLSMIEASTQVVYEAEQSITLMPGFEAKTGSDFIARIIECTPQSFELPAQARQESPVEESIKSHEVVLYPNPVRSSFNVEIQAFTRASLDIRLYDVLGKEINIFNHQRVADQGVQQFTFPADHLTAGLYYCRVKIGEEVFTRSFVRVE